MFTNLIESQSHKKDLKRRGSFVMFTMAAYALFFVFAGVVSIYAYDAQLETQDQGLEVLSFVPPVVNPEATVPKSSAAPSSSSGDPGVRPAHLPQLYAELSDTNKTLDGINTESQPIPPARGPYVSDPNGAYTPSSGGDGHGPIGTNGTGGNGNVVGDVGEPPPAKAIEAPAKPSTLRRSVINGLALSLPIPPYPQIARQIRLQGVVNVQVLLDETGKVVSARAVSGSPILSPAAVNAAYQARFSPTLIGNQPVKVSGVIVYNFRLE
ncbi:MAG: periplasmic protein TonB [Blastocatellia bacterium]|jgi:TonB family protein|nr:periplasmic protein TonB [Blastocatellia bacterium]